MREAAVLGGRWGVVNNGDGRRGLFQSGLVQSSSFLPVTVWTMLLPPCLMLATRQPPPRVLQAVVSSYPACRMLSCCPYPSRRAFSSGGSWLNPRKRGVLTGLREGDGVVCWQTAMGMFLPWGQSYRRQEVGLPPFSTAACPPGRWVVSLCAGRLVQVYVCSNAVLYGLEVISSLQL